MIPKFECVCCKVTPTAGKCRHCGDPVCMRCRLEDLHVCYCSCSLDADECTCGFRNQAFEQAEEAKPVCDQRHHGTPCADHNCHVRFIDMEEEVSSE